MTTEALNVSVIRGKLNILMQRTANENAARLHLAEETQQGRNSSPRLQFGFQFELYRVVAPLTFLRSISPGLHHCLLEESLKTRYPVLFVPLRW